MSLQGDESGGVTSAGKVRRLRRLCDAHYRFAMLAIDQRGSLRKMIAAKSGVEPAAVPDSALVTIKEIVTSAVAPLATAVLTDPLHGYPASPHAIPSGVGLLLALEVTGYEASGADERRSRLIEGWSARAIAQSGADAVKLLLWHRPDASDETLHHQDSLVEYVGAACAEEGLPYVLEVVSYPLPGQRSNSADFAREKPEIVIDAAKRYSSDRFGLDLLKLEFPGNLKYVAEFQSREWGAGETVHDLAQTRQFCERLDAASNVPWVILSAGVDPDEFIEDVQIAGAAGASGFLCGRAVWKHVVDHYPDETAMRRFARHTARDHFARIRKANSGARPWTEHPRYAGASPLI